ncbi:MAG TPA: Fic family protein [Kofleriaceae bacterium]
MSQGSYRAFLPRPLPPVPPIKTDAALERKLSLANLALGRLDGIGRFLVDADTWQYSQVRKEAVLSSQIEGTQSSLSDLLLHEHEGSPGVPVEDVTEVSNHVAAMNLGLAQLPKLSLSLRLVREVQRVLVTGSRGGARAAGELRRTQVWLGGATPQTAAFVPPPAQEVLPALGALERFVHASALPVLVKAALMHAQFETIHPFLDGNGRVGRILIPLLLVHEGALHRPLLTLSLYFKRHRTAYYDALQRVRTHGAWEAWIGFFLDGVAQSATEGVEVIDKLMKLVEHHRSLVEGSRSGSIYQRAAGSTNQHVFEYLRRRLALRVPEAARELGLTKPTVGRALRELQALGIAREATGKKRDRVYTYGPYVDLLM